MTYPDRERDLKQAVAAYRDTPLAEVVSMIAAEASARAADLRARRRHAGLAGEAMRLCLAERFGASHGWTLSQTSRFGLITLGRGKCRLQGQQLADPGNGWFLGEFRDLAFAFDHPYWYRRDGRAAAIAAHLYEFASRAADCAKLARRFGCGFETPDFPSWWFPGLTTLVVYVGPAGRASQPGYTSAGHAKYVSLARQPTPNAPQAAGSPLPTAEVV